MVIHYEEALYQVYAPLPLCNLVRSDAKTFNYSKRLRWLLFLRSFIHRLIYNVCLKCLPSTHMHVLSLARRWSMDQINTHETDAASHEAC